MTHSPGVVPPGVEWPPKADLRKDIYKPLPRIPPGTINPSVITGDIPTIQAKVVIDAFSNALLSNDVKRLASCFHTEQAYWRDIVALTSHLRTFSTPSTVAAALLHTKGLRGISNDVEIIGDAHFVEISPVMMFIDCGISFRTTSPALSCVGKMLLLPVKSNAATDSVSWKIWALSTWVENIVGHPENEMGLSTPKRDLDGLDIIETDVLIVGAGSSGLMTAARLKALGVESVVIDRNAQIGDNWRNRYDCLKFHVPTSSCEMPYAYYGKELQSPYRLNKHDVAEHLVQYATNFHLNVILSTTIGSTSFNTLEKKWTVKLKAADGSLGKTIISKHFVQASGIGSQKPYLPALEDQHTFKGLSIHSAYFRNAQSLLEQGIRSVAIIGSANTAFDIIQDCHAVGLNTTMVARSPTYVYPYEYVVNPHGFGAYDSLPLEVADRLMDRYLSLAKAGFPVFDSRDPSVDIQNILVERGGGHYVDVGGTNLIAEGKVAVRGRVEPVGYTETGLRLSDGSVLDTDAVILCTGFADKDVRTVALGVLGEADPGMTNKTDVLGPKDIVARLDATWGVDAEGEVRGVWKRHLRMENYWVMGGVIQQQRWWSRPMAQQIKLALEGHLPSAYRDTPEPN
ncbi:hypothetical protein F4815DRAFT_494773 [Daldinia loculata]|nr:hypothetical protein F4815DRAFT_494773 [Daldinia loculata]